MSRMLKGGCLLALLFLVMPSSALAARDWWVSPTGTGTACSQAVPCSYTYFIPAEPETSGDTVLFRGDLGSYGTQAAPLATGWFIPAGVTFKGAPGQPQPVLWSSAATALRMSSGNPAALSNFHIEATAFNAQALLVNGGADRVFANAPDGSACGATGPSAPTAATSTITNSVCTGDYAIFEGVLALNLTMNVRGSTLYGDVRGVYLNNTGTSPLVLNLTNSIVRRSATGAPDIVTDNGSGVVTVTADHSNFGSSFAGSANDTVPSPGSGTNQAAAPLFVNAAAGNFHEL